MVEQQSNPGEAQHNSDCKEGAHRTFGAGSDANEGNQEQYAGDQRIPGPTRLPKELKSTGKDEAGGNKPAEANRAGDKVE